jgi:hypothetical protein
MVRSGPLILRARTGTVRAYNVYDRPESPGVAKSPPRLKNPPRACQALISLYYNCNNLCNNHRIIKKILAYFSVLSLALMLLSILGRLGSPTGYPDRTGRAPGLVRSLYFLSPDRVAA